MAIDELNGLVFYSSFLGDYVRRASFPSFGSKTTIHTPIDTATKPGLAIDIQGQWVYTCEWRSPQRIIRFDYNGQNKMDVVNIDSNQYPLIIQVDPHGDFVYWVEYPDYDLVRALASGGGSPQQLDGNTAGFALDPLHGYLYLTTRNVDDGRVYRRTLTNTSVGARKAYWTSKTLLFPFICELWIDNSCGCSLAFVCASSLVL